MSDYICETRSNLICLKSSREPRLAAHAVQPWGLRFQDPAANTCRRHALRMFMIISVLGTGMLATIAPAFNSYGPSVFFLRLAGPASSRGFWGPRVFSHLEAPFASSKLPRCLHPAFSGGLKSGRNGFPMDRAGAGAHQSVGPAPAFCIQQGSSCDSYRRAPVQAPVSPNSPVYSSWGALRIMDEVCLA